MLLTIFLNKYDDFSFKVKMNESNKSNQEADNAQGTKESDNKMEIDQEEDKAQLEQPNLYPIQVLVDELRSEDPQIRLSAIRRLTKIASGLGEERTRRELIPFLTGNSCTFYFILSLIETMYDEGEVSIVLAEQLGSLTPYIGGVAYATCLLPPLEKLASSDDARDRAIASLKKLAQELSDAAISEHFIPMVLRLTSGEWFTSRCGGCALIDTAYERASMDQKLMLRK